MNENKNSINWGIIGCGDVCEVKSGPAFNKVPNSKLIAVMRRNYDKAKDYAQRHNVAKFYTNAIDLINDDEVNAIYVATPPSSHQTYVQLALQAGKFVYVEKPASINAASVKKMIEVQKKYAGKVSVAHYRRALPLFIKLKQLITENAIGKVKIIFLQTLQPTISKIITQTDDNWRLNTQISGGGLFYDLSPHQLDILYRIFGKPKNCKATTANQGKHYNAPDVTMLQLQFANDIYFNGTWNFNVPKIATQDSCEIIGEKGIIRFSFFKNNIIELNNNDGQQLFTLNNPIHIQQPHIANVVEYFLGKQKNPCSLQDALVSMKIMDKATLR